MDSAKGLYFLITHVLLRHLFAFVLGDVLLSEKNTEWQQVPGEDAHHKNRLKSA